MSWKSEIAINLSNIQNGLVLEITAKKENSIFEQDKYEINESEAPYQLLEGHFYDFSLSDQEFYLGTIQGNIIQPHKKYKYLGSIAPNIYVGSLSVPIFRISSEDSVGKIELEVQSLKTDYRTDYRDMMEYISEKCTELILKYNSPVSNKITPDFDQDAKTLYQRFSFIKSFLDSDDFAEAIHRIISFPKTNWETETEYLKTQGIRKFSNSAIKQLNRGSKRIPLPSSHLLRSYGIDSVPHKILGSKKVDTLDTSENRFIKHALQSFLQFFEEINEISKKFKEGNQLQKESESLLNKIESWLHHSFFSEISKPSSLSLNSPVLQRKEGYREVLRVWLMFDLAANLIWKGGDDVYDSGKKDIATLYEYWLFFKLLELFESVFQIKSKSVDKLIKKSPDGLNLGLKQGSHIALKGVFETGTRKLNVRFHYNRSFNGINDYPRAGSYTTTLRPDYTLSFWPVGIDQKEAELEELIVHIHFDAKYKVENLFELSSERSEEDLSREKEENKKGIYKNADLLKMHAYKDAIRRTGGAYILYPGKIPIERRGFHEIIPGLGAFPVSPSKTNSGIDELKVFILNVIDHFENRASQREKFSFRTFDIHKNPQKPEDEVRESLPELIKENRSSFADETFVLVGYYKSKEHLEWIEKERKYNFRTGTGNGSLNLDLETVTAKYLLLHSGNDENSNLLYKIVSMGPKVYSLSDLDGKTSKYPTEDKKNGKGDKFYLVIEIEPVNEKELMGMKWDFKKLKNFKTKNQSAKPFTATLLELLKVKIS